jgi:hypothetical protein
VLETPDASGQRQRAQPKRATGASASMANCRHRRRPFQNPHVGVRLLELRIAQRHRDIPRDEEQHAHAELRAEAHWKPHSIRLPRISHGKPQPRHVGPQQRLHR